MSACQCNLKTLPCVFQPISVEIEVRAIANRLPLTGAGAGTRLVVDDDEHSPWQGSQLRVAIDSVRIFEHLAN